MIKFFISLNIFIIKFYQYFFSSLLGNKCRYLPTCSEYYIESLKEHGLIKGSYFGIKRILSCHPFNFLGVGSGLDFVQKRKDLDEGKN